MWPFKKKPKTDRKDGSGFQNVLTGFGTERDKRSYFDFTPTIVTDLEARDLWRANDIAARVIEVKADEALRRGFEVKIQDDEAKLAEKVQARLEELKVCEKLLLLKKYANAYGGGAIFPIINDGQDLAAPLRENAITEVRRLQVLEPRELQPLRYYGDPRDEKFGEVELWRFVPISQVGLQANTGIVIHESRLVIMQGVRVTKQEIPTALPGWGDSVLTRVLPVLRDFDVSWQAAGALVQDFSQAVFKIDGLAMALASDQADLVLNRLRAMDLGRSVIRAIMLDKEEDFRREATPLSGLPELLEKFCQRLAAAAEMPVTILMGMSPAGLNATGESDRIAFYDSVASMQERSLRPVLEQLLRLLFLSKAGPTRGLEPENWSICFNPLWQPSEKEQADTRYVQAQTDAIYIDRGLPLEDVLQSRFGGDKYSTETTVDFEALRQYQEAEARAQEEALAVQKAALEQNRAAPEGEPPKEPEGEG